MLSLTILIFLQIKEWFSKVEDARGVAKRPAPSYMRFRDEQDEYQVSVNSPLSFWHLEACSASLSNRLVPITARCGFAMISSGAVS